MEDTRKEMFRVGKLMMKLKENLLTGSAKEKQPPSGPSHNNSEGYSSTSGQSPSRDIGNRGL